MLVNVRGEVPEAARETKRDISLGRNGKRRDSMLNSREKSAYIRFAGVRRMERRSGGDWFIWFSGVETTRGAGSRFRLGERRASEKPFASVSCLLEFCGGGISGGISAMGSAGSPSKNLAMAICKKHQSDLRQETGKEAAGAHLNVPLASSQK